MGNGKKYEMNKLIHGICISKHDRICLANPPFFFNQTHGLRMPVINQEFTRTN